MAYAEIVTPCESLNLIESDSMSLYFKSLHTISFVNAEKFIETVMRDLSAVVNDTVAVSLLSPPVPNDSDIKFLEQSGDLVDDVCVETFVDPHLLETKDYVVTEKISSDIVKSICLFTKNPYWYVYRIEYTGKKINKDNFLKYMLSYKHHNEFHEQCIERIFMDITRQCNPKKLTIYGRYTKRGSVDISTIRSSESISSIANFNMKISWQ